MLEKTLSQSLDFHQIRPNHSSSSWNVGGEKTFADEAKKPKSLGGHECFVTAELRSRLHRRDLLPDLIAGSVPSTNLLLNSLAYSEGIYRTE